MMKRIFAYAALSALIASTLHLVTAHYPAGPRFIKWNEPLIVKIDGYSNINLEYVKLQKTESGKARVTLTATNPSTTERLDVRMAVNLFDNNMNIIEVIHGGVHWLHPGNRFIHTWDATHPPGKTPPVYYTATVFAGRP